MADDLFTRMLMRAAMGDGDPSSRSDAAAAGVCLTGSGPYGGWEFHANTGGFIHRDKGYGMHAVAEAGELEFVWRAPDGSWPVRGVAFPITSVRHALDLLVCQNILPARFSTAGRRALQDLAEAHGRFSRQLESDAMARHRRGELTDEEVLLLLNSARVWQESSASADRMATAGPL